MQVILQVTMNEINLELIELIKTLLSRNTEIIIRKESVQLEEYNQQLPLEPVMQAFSQSDYSQEFLAELEQGLKTSSVYRK